MYALIDANNFYASCEAVFDPSIRHQPIVVLTNNDGCICAANRKAKALNIPKFEPYFKLKALCEQHGVVVRSSNYELYADLSHRMMQVIGRYAQQQYIYSIDETFLELSDQQQLIGDFSTYGREIRHAVYRETRLPVSVGIAATVTLAKAANYIAKNIKHYRGVAMIENEIDRQQMLACLSVGDVWGVGRQLSAKLNTHNIATAWQLANTPSYFIKQYFDINMQRTVDELNGKRCIAWDEVKQAKQQIYSTRSFSQRIVNQSSLQQALSQHVTIAAKKLRQQHSLVKQMVIFATNSPFDQRPISRKISHRFTVPTNDTGVMLQAVSRVIDQLFVKGVAFSRAGIGCIELIDNQFIQPDLFQASSDNPLLMDCIDGINQRYGRGTIQHAAVGVEPQYKMRRAYLSPAYTTNWRELPNIHC